MTDAGGVRVAQVFDVPVHGLDRSSVLATIGANIAGAREHCYVSITSSELLYNCRRSSFLPDYIRGARLSLADSISVVIAARLRGTAIARFPGPDLMAECARFGVARRWRHYYCGGAEGVADRLAATLSRRFPGLITAGSYCPPFRALEPAEEDAMIEAINAAAPDIVWVGLGVVKQEMWVARYRERLHAPWLIGVGGAFDFHAGTVARAPRLLQRCGLEWAFRLYQEPWRYKRISSSFVFLLEAAIHAALGRAPLLGGVKSADVPPAWQGKGSA